MSKIAALNSVVNEAQLRPDWRCYLALTKPKVVALMLLTTVVGMCLAQPGLPPLLTGLYALTGIGLMAASAAALNHLIDRRIDAVMARTRNRPLPAGALSTEQVLRFALGLGGAGLVILIWGVNVLTAVLTTASLVGYALVYTLYLKRATPQNIVIAGLAGAMPPLLGWISVTNQLDANAWLLVMIIFVWTPPHFWALALHRKEEYANAAIPMLPVTHGEAFTRNAIFLYTVLLAAVSLLPVGVGMSGAGYCAVSILLSAGFIAAAWRLKFAPHSRSAINTFRYSIYHLMLLFLALLIDHYGFY